MPALRPVEGPVLSPLDGRSRTPLSPVLSLSKGAATGTKDARPRNPVRRALGATDRHFRHLRRGTPPRESM